MCLLLCSAYLHVGESCSVVHHADFFFFLKILFAKIVTLLLAPVFPCYFPLIGMSNVEFARDHVDQADHMHVQSVSSKVFTRTS